MIKILTSKSVLALDYYFTQKLGLDYFDFTLNKKSENCLWQEWDIVNWSDLNNYLSSGINGIFDLQIPEVTDLILVKCATNLVLDENTAKFLAQNQEPNKEIYIYINSEEVNAALKKVLEKNELELIEIKELDSNQKNNLIKTFVDKYRPEAKKQLTTDVLNYLGDFDWLPALIDKIDFLELSQLDSWTEFVKQNIVFSPNVFRFSISKPLTPFQLKTIYTLFQNQEQNQLLLTMLYSQLKGKAEFKDWLSKLIQTDYLSKSKFDAILWAKLWMYDILK